MLMIDAHEETYLQKPINISLLIEWRRESENAGSARFRNSIPANQVFF
jgi:hypothetical protein